MLFDELRASRNSVINVVKIPMLMSGKDINIARRQKMLTQKELATSLGCNQSQIAALEKAQSFEELSKILKVDRLLKMCEILLEDNDHVQEVDYVVEFIN